MSRLALLAAPALVAAVLALPGCVMVSRPEPVVVVAEKNGPPPHAPAHGYRHKHNTGVMLRYDAALGVYLVKGHADVYFYDGWFVRLYHGVWQVSATVTGPWNAKRVAWVPVALRTRYKSKKHRHGEPVPAHGHW